MVPLPQMPDSGTDIVGRDLKSKLAGFVLSYISLTDHGDSPDRHEALRWVCAGLAYLLGELLKRQEGADRSIWIDGMIPAWDHLPDAVKVLSPVELTVRGSALWASGPRSPFWKAPFFAQLQISDLGDRIISYDIRFGDASRGLEAVPCDKRLRRTDSFFPSDWLFKFEVGRTAGSAGDRPVAL
jgi:hypothetical protein